MQLSSLDVTLQRINTIENQIQSVISFAQKPDTDFQKILETSVQKRLQEKDVVKLIGTLSLREQEIIKRRFGIDNEEPKTLEQIGKALGFSKERIRQIENIALQKLRRVDNVDCLKSYLDAG